MMSAPRLRTIVLGLFLLVLVLSVASCSRNNTIPEAFYPCGPAMGDDDGYVEHFVAWAAEGDQIIFDLCAGRRPRAHTTTWDRHFGP